MSGDLLTVRELTAFLAGPRGLRRILNRVNLRVRQGRTFALLGESGSGKTFLVHSLLGLHTGLPGVVSGEAEMLGVSLFRAPAPTAPTRKDKSGPVREIRRSVKTLLGRAVTLIPQDSLTSLPPFFPVGELLVQALRMGASKGPAATREKVLEWLARVHIYGAEEVAQRFLHELSGGMAQRVALALALAPGPQLLIADEPTTGLDATLRLNVLDLLATEAKANRVTLCLITHDMAAARLLAQDVAVLCHGSVVESGPADAVLDPGTRPKHPYTAYLLRAEGHLTKGTDSTEGSFERGFEAPSSASGCGYRLRCPGARPSCAHACPEPLQADPDHWISCHEVPR